MQDIIATLPDRVLNFKDYKGRTIIDYEFRPFAGLKDVTNARDMGPNTIFIITRPHSILGYRTEGNIQEAIDNRVTSAVIYKSYICPANSFEDDVYRLLDAGHIQRLVLCGDLKPNDKQYHVDFIFMNSISNITSYYNSGQETKKTIVLRSPIGPITNNLISLGYSSNKPQTYPYTITSKFIANTNIVGMDKLD